MMKFSLKKLKMSFCCIVQSIFQYLSAKLECECDRQKDGRADILVANAARAPQLGGQNIYHSC